MVILNFSNDSGSIALPFPKAGSWKDMLDGVAEVNVAQDGDVQMVTVSANYGMVFARQ